MILDKIKSKMRLNVHVECSTGKLGAMIVQREYHTNRKWLRLSVNYDYATIGSVTETSMSLKALTQIQKYRY
jgi:hypothetical protein